MKKKLGLLLLVSSLVFLLFNFDYMVGNLIPFFDTHGNG